MYTSFADMGESDLQERVDDEGYILLGAWNNPDGYEDSLYAILLKGCQLYEYEDSHCSCAGFELDPKPVTKAYLASRPCPSHYGRPDPEEFAQLIARIKTFNIR